MFNKSMVFGGTQVRTVSLKRRHGRILMSWTRAFEGFSGRNDWAGIWSLVEHGCSALS